MPVPAPELEPLPAPPGADCPLEELALLPDDPMLPEDGDEDDEPVAALPLFLPYWSELDEPVLALRSQAVIPTARMAAVSAAVMTFRFMASPLGWTTTTSSNGDA